ncbi:uncharacterized protein LOC132266271 [Cornus florida]|uniref:uncharacterized protein LOC132266271 n=1 Tax=Cornus florida TaxID=4283 RepID=UPI00289A444C|nr:uncharacterized protein LOC132266271 [Cornus florida]
MFYSAGLPFHLTRNPHYVASYTYASNNSISGYIPPGYNLLMTTLLQNERANIERLMIPIKDSWKENGVTIVCDGWTDPQRRPIINFMAMSVNGPMFLKAVNCEGEFKDKFFILELIKEPIQEVGPDNVVQVITNNAPVCRSAGLLVEVQFPKVFWTPYVVHTLNLALKNICAAKNTDANEVVFLECHWITTIIDDCMFIKKFKINHSMRLAMFHENVKLTMLYIADTRFPSIIVMLRRFKRIKRGLQDMVMSDFWTSYRKDNVQRALTVKTKIVSDDWWRDIDYIINFTEPIYDMLRRADTDVPCLHLVYEMWDSMIAKVKVAIYHHERKQEHEEYPFFLVVRKILSARWSKSNTPLY